MTTFFAQIGMNQIVQKDHFGRFERIIAWKIHVQRDRFVFVQRILGSCEGEPALRETFFSSTRDFKGIDETNTSHNDPSIFVPRSRMCHLNKSSSISRIRMFLKSPPNCYEREFDSNRTETRMSVFVCERYHDFHGVHLRLYVNEYKATVLDVGPVIVWIRSRTLACARLPENACRTFFFI